MKVVISQSMFFPGWVLLEQLKLADLYVFYDDVQFSKGSFTNRVQVKASVDRMQRIYFAQKDYLSLYLLDRIESAEDVNWLASLHHEQAPMNPSLSNLIFRDYFSKHTLRERLDGPV